MFNVFLYACAIVGFLVFAAAISGGFLYFLETEYDDYKEGFYKYDSVQEKFVLIDLKHKPYVKYVSTFENEEGDTEILYYLDTAYNNYKVGFYRFIKATNK